MRVRRVTGVGDAAKFFNDKNRWANLIVWTGARHFTALTCTRVTGTFTMGMQPAQTKTAPRASQITNGVFDLGLYGSWRGSLGDDAVERRIWTTGFRRARQQPAGMDRSL